MTRGGRGVSGAASDVKGPADVLDGGDGVLCKPSKSLCHQRDEICPGGAAGREIGGQLTLHPNLQGVARCLGCLCNGELLQRADDVNVKCSGSS